MTHIWLARHGQASWGADDYDVLSPLGWEQGRMLGDSLRARSHQPHVVVRGDMRRHAETLEALVSSFPLEVGTIEDAGWNELDHNDVLAQTPMPTLSGDESMAAWGLWFDQAIQRWVDGDHDADYAETFAAFTTRVNDALDRVLVEADTHGPTLVVTSGGVISWVTATLLTESRDHTNPATVAAWRNSMTVLMNTSITKLTLRHGAPKLVAFNDHAHLEGEGSATHLTYV